MKGWSERNEEAQKAYEFKRDERRQAEPGLFKVSKTVKFDSMFGWLARLFNRNKKMNVSQEGLNLIKHFEGFYPAAYKCAADVWTIGYGTTSTKPGGHDDGTIKPDMTISEPQAVEYLAQDLGYFEEVVDNLTTAPTQQWMFDALVSFAFNLGEGNLRKSTLLKLHNEGEYDSAANEFVKWNKASGRTLNGLTRRRASEERLYRKEDNYLVESTTDLENLGYPVV